MTRCSARSGCPPGLREGTVGRLYLAYLRDPDGNKICGLYRLPKD